MTREEWVTFYIYMEYINDFMKKFSFNFKKYLEEKAEKKPLDRQ